MYKQFEAAVHKETKDGTYLYVLLPQESLANEVGKFAKNGILTGELRIDDGRTISSKQRKKAWATLGDISLWNARSLPVGQTSVMIEKSITGGLRLCL